MKNVYVSSKGIKNFERPFSELFRLLKRYDRQVGQPMLVYTTRELCKINLHADNAIDVLLQGLNGIAHFLTTATSLQKINKEANHIGYLVSAISNLAEALNDLKTDIDYVLEKRGASNY